MTGPWEKYQGKPWEKYAAQAPASTPAVEPPDDSPGALDYAGDFLRATAHNFMRIPHGGAQLIEHGVAGGLNLIAPNTAVSNYANKVVSQDDAALAQWERQYQQETPDNAASYTGAVLGNVVSLGGGAGARLQ